MLIWVFRKCTNLESAKKKKKHKAQNVSYMRLGGVAFCATVLGEQIGIASTGDIGYRKRKLNAWAPNFRKR